MPAIRLATSADIDAPCVKVYFVAKLALALGDALTGGWPSVGQRRAVTDVLRFA